VISFVIHADDLLLPNISYLYTGVHISTEKMQPYITFSH